MDSTIARAHQHATNITRPPATQGGESNYINSRIEPPDHAIGRSHGGLSTKIHHLVDGHGLPLVVLVSPGQSGDCPAFPHLLEHLKVPRLGGGRPRTRPDRVRGDKAYSSRANRELLRRRGIGAVISEPSDQAGRSTPADFRGRNVVERRFCHLKQ